MTEQEMPGWQKQKNQEEERQAQSAVMPTEPENEELEAEMIRMEGGASAPSSPPWFCMTIPKHSLLIGEPRDCSFDIQTKKVVHTG